MTMLRSTFLGLAAGTVLALTAATASADGGPRGSAKYAPEALALSWSGFYAGIHLGGGWGDSSMIYPNFPVSSATPDIDGVVAGGHVGWNAQFGNFVLGAEVSLSTGPRGSELPNAAERVTVDVSPLLQVVGRVGYTAGHTLVYGLGGYAGADIEATTQALGAPNRVQDSQWHNGWVAGAGVEYMLHPNVVFGIEYRHVELEDVVHNGFNNFGGAVAVRNHRVDADFDIVQARLSIKFGR